MLRLRGQVIMIIALALPAMLGLIGLAIDWGYSSVAWRAAQNAASNTARTAALYVQKGDYANATANGQAIGQRNMSPLNLSGVGISLAYYNGTYAGSTSCDPNTAVWSTATPNGYTRCVRATVSGTYNTLFMRVLGVNSSSISRRAVVALGGSGVRPFPFAICGASRSAPWTVWQAGGGVYGSGDVCNPTSDTNITKWEGLVQMITPAAGTSVGIKCLANNNYPSFENWLRPPGSVPAPEPSITLFTAACAYVPSATWLGAYPMPIRASIVDISVPDPRSLVAQVNGCRAVDLQLYPAVGSTPTRLTATPVAGTTLDPNCTNGSLATLSETN